MLCVWSSVRLVMARAWTGTGIRAGGAVDSDRSLAEREPCPHCAGTGVLTWQQPHQTDDGMVLREMTHPCPAGCGDTWRHPAGEGHRVVDPPSSAPQRVRGHADEAGEIGGDFIAAYVARAMRRSGDGP